MTLQSISSRSIVHLAATLLLGAAVPTASGAAELPTRKPGLWEIRMTEAASKMPGMTMQQCTDETTEKEMLSTFSPTATKEVCSKQDIRKTASGYVAEAICTVNGMSMTSHSDITGDFNSAYTMKVTSQGSGVPSGAPLDIAMTIEAKWLGPCKPGQKAGDMIMPGGFKMNIKDMQKLQGLLPKQ